VRFGGYLIRSKLLGNLLYLRSRRAHRKKKYYELLHATPVNTWESSERTCATRYDYRTFVLRTRILGVRTAQ
jgi:hypothetical protein